MSDVKLSDLETAWKHVLSDADPSTKAWLRDTQPLTIHDSHIMVAVANDFTRQRIETHYRSQIEEALSDFFKRDMHLAITVEAGLELSFGEAELVNDGSGLEDVGPIRLIPRPDAPYRVSPDNTPTITGEPTLNPRYNFDTFVIGSSNRFAHAAATAVAESPGRSYNPLLIYGGSGLGKTHLLHAIGHYLLQYYQGIRVKYVSTEQMTNDFINAIQNNSTAAFRRSYRNVDVLLIDDIQFLESKIQTQEEFFHTFNTLHNAQRQIVMTSDRPPKALETLESRLRSRFQSGLITDIQPPDIETRIAILRKKQAIEHLSVPDDVLEFIANRIHTNIRELEGALIRVSAFASLNRQQPSLAVAETVLRDLVPDQDSEVNISTIIGVTSSYFGVTVDDLLSTSRTQALVLARQIAMYLAREMTSLSLPRIGQEFGGRDHTTVMHAFRKIKNLMRERHSIYNYVTELTTRIRRTE
ncbi:MAG: chromosomal replication initiator protein DnaA [Propionibacteriaceae bacterium]|jgi:chromosomal replication initiator protein|nr:chromosomal replication initiator protein DnaA [Propionibacteriaceae bacterium]